MKLSEVKGERAADVIADIIPIVYSLSVDKDVAPLFAKPNIPPVPKGVDPEKHFKKYSDKIVKDRVTKYMPHLLKKYKHEIYMLIATINGIEYAEYTENIHPIKLFADMCEVVNDPAIIGLFPSAQNTDSSTSAQENTEGDKV